MEPSLPGTSLGEKETPGGVGMCFSALDAGAGAPAADAVDEDDPAR